MSREIKFRMWDNNKNKMYYGGELDDTDTSDGIFVGAAYDDEEERLLSETCRCIGGDWQGSYWKTGEVIEQYTGLLDRNGKEIYGGDIIGIYQEYSNKDGSKTWEELEPWGQVVYECDKARFGIWGESPYEGEDKHFFDLTEGLEVIGNIHEPIDKPNQV